MQRADESVWGKEAIRKPDKTYDWQERRAPIWDDVLTPPIVRIVNRREEVAWMMQPPPPPGQV